MARSPNEKAEKAHELYKGGMKLVEIASQLDVPAGTVRRWKSTYDWDNERSDCKTNESERSLSVSWVEIEHEYVTDISRKPCSLENLAKKYSIPIDTIKDRSAKDGWVRKRTEYTQQTLKKAKEKSSDTDADRIARLLSIADKAAEKTEQALGELEQYVVRDKKKIKTVEYNDETAIGKPTKEVINETEHINIESGLIDRLGLSQVTGALKNLKDIYMMPVALEKQSAETALLKAKSQGDDETEIADDGFVGALNGSAEGDWTDEEG